MTPIDLPAVASDRIVRLYQYLQALHRSRTTPIYSYTDYSWHLLYRSLPIHPCIQVDSLEDEEEAFLAVRRPELVACPSLPELLEEWVESGWEKIEKQPVFRVLIDRGRSVDGELMQEKFEDSEARVQAQKQWLLERDAWVGSETPAYQTMKVFEHLYGLWGTLQRDPDKYELILGDGFLGWKRLLETIQHPLLLCRLQLEFDSKIPEFKVTPADRPVAFATPLFQSLSDVDSKAVARLREGAKEEDLHPLEGDEVDAFLKGVATTLSSQGQFVEAPPDALQEYPQLWRDPVIYLAPRNGGFEKALEDILSDLEKRQSDGLELPNHLARIVGATEDVVTSSFLEPDLDDSANPSVLAPSLDVLFTKPANREQEQIAERLEQHGCVLVQGPPGTGKTHTIGNLIGHLLAQGKTVLVTSHTPKALRVLRDQVVDELRSLCVAVLNDGNDSRSQLEASVSSIVEKLQSASVEDFKRQASSLSSERKNLQDRLRGVESELLKANENEYREIVVDGKAYPPSEAARLVTSGIGVHDWIPGEIAVNAPLPLSTEELAELYSLNIELEPDEERQLSFSLPDLELLISPEQFTETLKKFNEAQRKASGFTTSLWRQSLQSEHAGLLVQILQSLKKSLESIAIAESWELELMEQGDQGGTQQRFSELITLIEETEKEGERAESALLNYNPQLPGTGNAEEMAITLEEMIAHLKAGKSLNALTLLTRGKWKALQNEAKVKGRKPETLEAFEALHALISIERKRSELARRWTLQVKALGGADLPAEEKRVERACRRFVSRILSAINWKKAEWQPTLTALSQIGFAYEPFEILFRDEQETNAKRYVQRAERLRGEVEARLAQIEGAEAKLVLNNLSATLKPFAQEAGEGVAVVLYNASLGENLLDFDEAYAALGILLGQREPLFKRRQLLAKLERSAPGWAAVLRVRAKGHEGATPPGDPQRAWLYAQLRNELERRDLVSPEELSKQRTDLGERLFRTTAELAQCRAWGFQLARTTDSQRSSLMGWLNTVRKIGKGTGKTVATLRKAAREQMQNSSSAVPVWIMPLAQVAETFAPNREPFDVVIVDEASQADLMGLIPLYFAKSVIVVGDHEQVSPDAVGQRSEEAQRLIAQYLDGIPNAVLYDGLMSVYDIARAQFGGTISLSEHFRCAPEIIEFSNRLSYEGRIKPLREVSSVATRPYVVSQRVEDGVKSRKVNMVEANEIASLVLACLEMPEYAGLTFGVISLVGVEQAVEIEKKLRQLISPEVYENRRILCGTPPQFQGDERDVIFLSMVEGSLGKPLAMRDGEGSYQRWKKRYNVAASRARNQMWVVHSVSHNTDLKQGDIRRRLIEHGLDPMAFQRNAKNEKGKADSDFEVRVIERLINAGYRVTAQYPVGACRIDIVVDDGHRRLAVECDGDRYHPIEKLPEDMDRQAILERLGWRFVRIRGSVFYRDADNAMAPVFDRLKLLGIQPIGNATEVSPDENENALLFKVRRRAAIIREEWDVSIQVGKPDTEEIEDTFSV